MSEPILEIALQPLQGHKRQIWNALKEAKSLHTLYDELDIQNSSIRRNLSEMRRMGYIRKDPPTQNSIKTGEPLKYAEKRGVKGNGKWMRKEGVVFR